MPSKFPKEIINSKYVCACELALKSSHLVILFNQIPFYLNDLNKDSSNKKKFYFQNKITIYKNKINSFSSKLHWILAKYLIKTKGEYIYFNEIEHAPQY